MKKQLLLLSLVSLCSLLNASMPDSFQTYLNGLGRNVTASKAQNYWNNDTGGLKTEYMRSSFGANYSPPSSSSVEDRAGDSDDDSAAASDSGSSDSDDDLTSAPKGDTRMTQAAQLMAEINADNPNVWEEGVRNKLVSALQNEQPIASSKKSRSMGRLGKRKSSSKNHKRKSPTSKKRKSPKSKSSKLSARQKKRKAHLKATKKGHKASMKNKMKVKNKKGKVNRKKVAPKKASSSGRYKS